MNRLLLSSILAVAAVAPLAAQTRPVAEGSKVRFTTVSDQKLVGVVRATTSDSLTVYTEPAGIPATIALSSISNLQISRGKSAMEGAKRGGLWGAGVGAGLVGLAYLIGDGCNSDYGACGDEPGTAAEALGIGAIGGAVWGILIGAIVGREKWESVAVRPAVGAVPGSARIGLAIGR